MISTCCVKSELCSEGMQNLVLSKV